MTQTGDTRPAPGQSTSVLRFSLLALLLAALLAAALFAQQRLEPDRARVQHTCDLQQGPCRVTLAEGTLQLEASPRPLRSLTPIDLRVQLDGLQARQIQADLQGAEMYMGVNRFALQPAGDHWQGRTELAVCTTGTMRWQLTLEIATDDGLQQHQFEFDAR